MLSIILIKNLLMKRLSQQLNKLWYHSKRKPLLLKIAAHFYNWGRIVDKFIQQKKASFISSLPVIVIGNLTVGGTGKTPLIVALHQKLIEEGYRVGIITRGYKNKLSNFPHLVTNQDSSQIIGDEAALLFQKTKAPIVISARRQQAIDYLTQHQLCDVILSDDGLQHIAMPRALEIVVIDGQRGFGNHELLPLGPLREPLSRLASIDLILINGTPNQKLQEELKPYQNKLFYMHIQAEPIYPLHSEDKLQSPLAAFAGIGHPERFFQTLQDQGFKFKPYIFTDHHQYSAKDFVIPESCIIMTEKDAIKCQEIKNKSIFVLPITLKIEHEFWQKFLKNPIFKQ